MQAWGATGSRRLSLYAIVLMAAAFMPGDGRGGEVSLSLGAQARRPHHAAWITPPRVPPATVRVTRTPRWNPEDLADFICHGARDDALRSLMRRGASPPARHPRIGAGVVVDAEVHVVTADTLVGCEATAEVQFGDGRTGIGHVIGRDPVLDVALLEVKVAGSPVAMASVGDVAALRVGSAIAVPVWDREGPPGLHLRQGKVLEVGRAAAPRFSGPYIGTDIPSELAEVGGPLLDAGGKVVGLIVSSGPPSGHGASAIPMDAVRGLLPQLARLGRVPRGWVGFVPQPCTPPLADALGGGYEGDPVVAHVVRGGPADRAGIRPGDVVVMFSGVRVRSVEALADAIAKAEVGSIVRVDTLRGGRLYPFSVHVAETPQSSGWPPRPDPLLQLSIHVLPVTPGLRSLWDPRLANGLLVTRVASAGAGEAAGLEPGDLLRAVNGHPLEGREAVGVANQALRTGGRILWLVERGGVTRLVVTATQSEGTRPRGPGDRSRREGRSNLAHGR